MARSSPVPSSGSSLGCAITSSTASGPGSPVITSETLPPAPSATPPESAAASAGPSTAAKTPAPTTAAATQPPVSAWTGAQLFILSGIDKKIRPSCVPATQLPDGADAGVECTPAGPASLVGFYRFPKNSSLNPLYRARLADNGVKLDSGNACQDGKPGEGVDIPGVDAYAQRIGCYIDAAGVANLRIRMPGELDGQGIYIGVVGKDKDIGALVDWVNRSNGGAGCMFCIDLWTLP